MACLALAVVRCRAPVRELGRAVGEGDGGTGRAGFMESLEVSR
jgi:hypothetical protein